ncbi:MAG: hypothetical protein J7497_12940, partial [Chitinophagaceae bacterium]|nr:hypothetical protein [Chitinophagaceae bacterium]
STGKLNWPHNKTPEVLSGGKYVHLSMSTFRLNRLAFKAQTAEEAANHSSYYKKLSWQERLKIAAYLNSIAFNYPENNPPKLDRTIFKAVARNN